MARYFPSPGDGSVLIINQQGVRSIFHLPKYQMKDKKVTDVSNALRLSPLILRLYPCDFYFVFAVTFIVFFDPFLKVTVTLIVVFPFFSSRTFPFFDTLAILLFPTL